MSESNGKTAVVTGGSSGIGLAIARRLANEGAQVVITGRRQAVLGEVQRRFARIDSAGYTNGVELFADGGTSQT